MSARPIRLERPLLLIGSFLLQFGSIASPTAAEGIVNGGFEDRPGPAAGWVTTACEGVDLPRVVAPEGVPCSYLLIPGATQSAKITGVFQNGLSFDLQGPSGWAVVEFDARTEGGPRGKVSLDLDSGLDLSRKIPDSPTWSRYFLSLPLSGSTFGRIEFVTCSSPGSELHIDNVRCFVVEDDDPGNPLSTGFLCSTDCPTLEFEVDTEDPSDCCFEDVSGDGRVDVTDLLTLLEQWGPCAGCSSDFDFDEMVAVADLLALLGAWGSCSPDFGACCFPDGSCLETFEDTCGFAGGAFRGEATTCLEPCPAGGACCLPDGACVITGEAPCAEAGGTYQGEDTDCSPDPCMEVGACCVTDPGTIDREVVLCLDVSGSIGPEELELEIDGLIQCLRTQIPQDGSHRVAIVVYGRTVAAPLPELTPLTPTTLPDIEQTLLDLLEDRIVLTSATNLGGALVLSRAILSGDQSESPNDFILLVGDGAATTGPDVQEQCAATAEVPITICAIAVGASLEGELELEACALETGGEYNSADDFADFLPVCDECVGFVVGTTCTVVSEAGCAALGGDFQGVGTNCAPKDPCEAP